jgi:hypothetical protein
MAPSSNVSVHHIPSDEEPYGQNISAVVHAEINNMPFYNLFQTLIVYEHCLLLLSAK